MTALNDDQYTLLFTFRQAVRQFLRWSEQQAAQAGLTPQQHQLLLAIRAHNGAGPPSIGELARYLLTRSNSTVELVSRVEALGLIRRHPDPVDQRVVRLWLTQAGEQLLDKLASAHLEELEHVAAQLHISESFLQRLSADFLEKTSGPDA